MNTLYDLPRHLDKYRELYGQEPPQQAVQFFTSFCAALVAMHHIGQQSRRQGVRIDPGEFQRVMPEDAHPEIIKSLYIAFSDQLPASAKFFGES